MNFIFDPIISALFLLITGSFFGSFANVCIYRWPRNQSIRKPIRSHCPWCKIKIKWFDNIPVLSFMVLKGSCRSCGGSISFRYPLIELMLPLIWGGIVVALTRSDATAHMLFYVAMFFLAFELLVAGATDLEWKIIPDQSSLPLIIVGCAVAPWNVYFLGDGAIAKVTEAIVGGATGGGSLLLIAMVGRKFFGKEVMGWGDIKLFCGIGAFLGWEGVLTAGVIGSVAGGLFASAGLLWGTLKRHQYIPFGPFLVLGTFVTIFFLSAGTTSLWGLGFLR